METLTGVPTDNELQGLFRTLHISCIASGTIDGVQKYFFYAHDVRVRSRTQRARARARVLTTCCA